MKLFVFISQVINNKIVSDFKRVSLDFKTKHSQLRTERLKLIQAKAKEVLDIDWNIDEFMTTGDDTEDNEVLPTVPAGGAAGTDTTDGVTTEENMDLELPTPCEIPEEPMETPQGGNGTEEPVVSQPPDTSEVAEPSDGVGQPDITPDDGSGVAVDDNVQGGDSVAPVVSTPPDATTVNTTNESAEQNTTDTDTNSSNENNVVVETPSDSALDTNNVNNVASVESMTRTAPVRRLSLTELAPTPTDTELFGNLKYLEETHQKQMEEFDRAQEMARNKQQQDLKEKLRERQNKRRKMQVQQMQETALRSDVTVTT